VLQGAMLRAKPLGNTAKSSFKLSVMVRGSVVMVITLLQTNEASSCSLPVERLVLDF
jgi:hypothetical protein